MLSERGSERVFGMGKRITPYLRPILWVLFGIFAALLLARALSGELTAPLLKIRSPLNAESFVAVSFLLLVLLRARGDEAIPRIESKSARATGVILSMLLLLCLAAFYRSLGKPLLFDDYGHVTFASQASWGEILGAFYRPHPDIFFRPIGFLSYFIDFHWAHFDPFRWHSMSLGIHALNCVFVYILARQLEFASLPSATAAAVFAIHGTRAETVCWTDARFDLLSTLFVLLTLISLEQYVRQKSRSWLAGSYLFTVLAICTKEAAFALPLMLLVMSMFHGKAQRARMRAAKQPKELAGSSGGALDPSTVLRGPSEPQRARMRAAKQPKELAGSSGGTLDPATVLRDSSEERRRRLLRSSPVIFALVGAGFIYRLWMIKGVGGYQTNGHANILTFSAIRFAKGLLWRLWALAFFPINWSAQASMTVALSMAAFVVLLAVIGTGTRVNKRRLLGALLLVVAASLPVEHLLLIGSDLAGARILYLPMLGIALFWAVVCEAHPDRKYIAYAIPAVVLYFNLACLEGNITIWTQVAEAARSACQTFGRQIANFPGTVEVTGLPSKYRGVYFLTNGFADCVHINSGVPADRIITVIGNTAPSHTFRWNEESHRFDETGRIIR